MKKIILFTIACLITLSGCSQSPQLPPESQSTQPEVSSAPESEKPASETEAQSEPQQGFQQEPVYPPFTGVKLSQEALSVSTVNRKNSTKNSTKPNNIFCFGEDTIYFSNPADGWKLYSYDGEKAKPLSEIKALELAYYDGCVYFASYETPGYDFERHPSGEIYKYDTLSGETVLISQRPGYNLQANENGLFFTRFDDDDVCYVYEIDPESGEEERLCCGDNVYLLKDYIITREPSFDGSWNYMLEKENEKICFLQNKNIEFDFIHNGVFYYNDIDEEHETFSVDLSTGEVNRLDDVKLLTFFDGTKYFNLKSPIGSTSRYDIYEEKEGIAEKILIEGFDMVIGENYFTEIYLVKYLYTDGKSIYGLFRVSDDPDEMYFARLEQKKYYFNETEVKEIPGDGNMEEIPEGSTTMKLTSINIIGNKEDNDV